MPNMHLWHSGLAIFPAVFLASVMAVIAQAGNLERLPPVWDVAPSEATPPGTVGPPENARPLDRPVPQWNSRDEEPGGVMASGYLMPVMSSSVLSPDAAFVPYRPEGASLESRLAELEAAIKKMKDAEEAAKKKAAGGPSVTPFGKIHWDSATFAQNPASLAAAGDMLNGTEFRRARIGVQGKAYQVIDYRLEMDFAGEVTFKDVYVDVTQLPILGNIRMGHFKECLSLEILNSDDYTTFIERSLIDGGGILGHIGDRNPGIMAFDWNEQETMTWQYGVFVAEAGERPPTFPKGTIYDDVGGAAFDARTTYLPWVFDADEFKGRGLLHTGFAYSYRSIPALSPNAPANSVRYSLLALPECNLANNVVDTGPLNDTNHVNVLRPELAMVYGPFSLQTEYMWFFLDRSRHPDPDFNGGYMSLAYLLTGENRNYDRTKGLFRGVVPFENFFRVRDEKGDVRTGLGAWEVAYRISYLNLSSKDVQGGRVVDHTVGLNWYMTPYNRFMVNFVHSETNGRRNPKGGVFGPSIVNIVETRIISFF